MACSSPAGLDGLLCCADERLNDLSIPPSHDRTLARRADASKPKTSTYVDSNEDDRRPATYRSHASCIRGQKSGSSSLSKVGARCVSSARRDLCGGRGEILVPTATAHSAASKCERVVA